MAKFIVASVLCACLLLEGIYKVQATNGDTAGDSCTDNNGCTGTGLICVDKKCQTEVKTAGDSCAEANTACTPDKLTCQDGKCKLKVDQSCTGNTDKCLANAECKGAQGSEKCTCQDGYKASEDKTKCGAMGIASSMLLVIATFVTSRFF